MPLEYFSYVRIDFLATELKRDKYKKRKIFLNDYLSGVKAEKKFKKNLRFARRRFESSESPVGKGRATL